MSQRTEVQYIRFYTDGSVAHKVAPTEPLKTIKLPKIKKHKRVILHIDPVAIAGIAMAAVMMILMTIGVVQLANTRQELQTMSSYVDTLQQKNWSLQSTYKQGYDLETIEKTAHALGLVPKEQVKHVTIHVPEADPVEEPGLWERFYILLTGLFA